MMVVSNFLRGPPEGRYLALFGLIYMMFGLIWTYLWDIWTYLPLVDMAGLFDTLPDQVISTVFW